MKEMIRRGDVDPGKVRFNTLLGVRTERIEQLAREGYHAGVYVPFGDQWWAYTCRRIAERPANGLFVLRSLVG